MSEHNLKGTNSNTPASNSPLADALWAALGTVEDPELRHPITELGMVERAQAVSEDDGGYVADVKILLTIEGCPLKTTIEQDVRKAAGTVEGITRVQVEVGAMNADQRSALKSQLKPERTNPFTAPGSLTRVFAVVSGKGGVGKSSMTANLAAAFASRGLAVGIIDADVHGFSIPGLLGVHEAPTRLDDLIIPPAVDAPRERGQVRGDSPGGFVKVISIGMFLKGNQPVAWRGPMLHRALEQFILDVHFGALDILLLDLPPGTGDIAISMSQLLPNAELVLVSTPQHAAVDVAERAGTLSLQTHQKVSGVIENMAAMTLPDGTVLEMFGSGGGAQLAHRLSSVFNYPVPLLGSVPLDVSLRTGGDEGTPIVWSDPNSPTSAEIQAIAGKLLHRDESLAGKPLRLNV